VSLGSQFKGFVAIDLTAAGGSAAGGDAASTEDGAAGASSHGAIAVTPFPRMPGAAKAAKATKIATAKDLARAPGVLLPVSECSIWIFFLILF
jgi:hypothetical protein